MSDLSERLRYATRDVVTGQRLNPGSYGHAPIADLEEAADEIERLTESNAIWQEVAKEVTDVAGVNTLIHVPAEIERLQKVKELAALRKQKQIAVDALFSICQSDWGIGHSLAKPAHKAIKELAALEGDADDRP
jgi:hypothetical protein